MGRGMILGATCAVDKATPPQDGSRPTTPYLNQCVKAFLDILLKQNTTTLTRSVGAESIFFSNRFSIPVSNREAADWQKYVGLKRVTNIIDAQTDAIFTDEEIDENTFTSWRPKTFGTLRECTSTTTASCRPGPTSATTSQ